MFIQEKILLGKGKPIIIETGLIATQSDGSVLLRIGNTILLSTVVLGKRIKKNSDFIPLTIDYREKYFAIGKIPGGFIKREGKPSDQEILTMRIVDRLIRPFLSKKIINEIQIIITLLSYDYKVLPDGLAGLASSAALLISGIPFKGPVSQIRLARINNKFIINPNINQIKESDINLIIGGTLKSIIMIDGEMKEITNKELIKIIEFAHKVIIKLINLQIKFLKKVKKYITIKKIKLFNFKQNKLNKYKKSIFKKKIKYLIYYKIYKIIKKYKKKKDRNKKLKILLKYIIYLFNNYNEYYIKKYFYYFKKKIIIKLIINENLRLDGRHPKDIRNIWGIINYLPGVHGSAIFTRGETQSLTTVTLGSSLDVNKIDNVVIESNEKFYLHYNFHPFSTGEVKLITGISRREIGHGTLAKKAFKNIIPLNNPYTIRIVSDILESNGSSSMATVCAASLALMDAGIKIKNPVAGISMGLIKNKKKNIILYDILGEEDHYGNMDFKITRTIKGITACQMDIKNINIVNINILKKILKKSKKGILKILNIMNNILSKPRNNIKSTSPILTLIKIPKQYIGIIIGGGGKTIQDIQSRTDTNIIITEKNNQGIIEIFGKKKNIDKAIKIIKNIIFIPKIGNIYKGKVISIKNFGVFIELSKGVEGLLHYSEINFNIYIGDIIKVKYLGIDKNTGKIKLSLNYEKNKN
ncbi:polyribonucleotide nucleotidyltransferase [Candidatus Shikimatogenerans bostrichidophilus]|uniref:polyribonucleotide nucleotidyltransferase n=1 Tax=Candidatus Shikimatogenerans bostrichidophilus TaxID=2943807 RepID=UPI002966635E